MTYNQDIGTIVNACMYSYKERYIKNIIDELNSMQTELNKIQHITGCNQILQANDTLPPSVLEDFKNLTEIDYYLIRLRDKLVSTRRDIKYLEREIIENGEQNVTNNR